jgi:hypothetical protein
MFVGGWAGWLNSRFADARSAVSLRDVNSSSPPPALELQLAPASSAFPSSDQRWQNQVAQLLNDLRRNAGEVRKEITPVPGQKGGAEAIILALGTSGALTAAVAVFKAWLGRATDRAIRMKAKVGDRTVEIELSGSNISESTLRAALGLAKDGG